ncbi:MULTISPECIES: aminotransferase class IV [Legionella]|uniref:Aminodeoxychorismate lyase n=1 Tax=Legionella drozanskii LLAP-1 TaxID=1212489 RepID=A0A0W0SRV1_9GAMM|nr:MULTISPECIES: aminotransferase class IV [Legionella]KTC85964.1 aminodeoxychorismate lyase [Legionella drozanskii LLAP-1]PJE17802.1 MAG: 4-amino-4-deoxychorismate lyase [Legionella sp.]
MPTLIFIQENEADFSFALDDRIFIGEGLFETIRIVEKKPCYPKAHWQRLKKAAAFLGITFEVSFEQWLENLKHCIRLKKIQEGGVKVILSGGRAPRGLVAQGSETYLIFNAFHYSRNSQALDLISAPWRRDEKNPIYQLKSINYLEAIIARRGAETAKANEILFFNFQDHATETSVANFFIIKNDCLITPPTQSGVLPGIIRGRLLVLCKQRGVNCSERELTKENLMQADAAFTCNALQGLQPVRSFDGQLFNVNHPMLPLLSQLLVDDRG